MSPMEVEIKSWGPVMDGLTGAGVTACGASGWAGGAPLASAGGSGACPCASAGADRRRAKPRAGIIFLMTALLAEHDANKKPRDCPRLSAFHLSERPSANSPA